MYCKEFHILNQSRNWLWSCRRCMLKWTEFDSCWKKNFNSYALMPSRVCTVVNKRLEDWNLRIQRLQRCVSLICVWNAVDWGLFFYAPCWYSTLLVNIHLHSVSTWEEMTKEVLYSVLFFVNTSTPHLPLFSTQLKKNKIHFTKQCMQSTRLWILSAQAPI